MIIIGFSLTVLEKGFTADDFNNAICAKVCGVKRDWGTFGCSRCEKPGPRLDTAKGEFFVEPGVSGSFVLRVLEGASCNMADPVRKLLLEKSVGELLA
ncbi:MAG TPA: hypothetical protein VJ327_06330 [Patescibacteria group bacterium]|nr:hypothetical protein [Patescibacteria group bacterium]